MSTLRTEPQPRFGTASRAQARRVFVSQAHQATDLHGVDGPGPAHYTIKSAVGGESPIACALCLRAWTWHARVHTRT